MFANNLIRINKPTSHGVVVTGVEVIEAALGVVVISAVAEGVVHADSRRLRAGNGNARAPCVGIGILHYKLSVGVINSRYISLKILAEDVIEAVYTHAHGSTVLVVIVPNDGVVLFLTRKLCAVVEIFCGMDDIAVAPLDLGLSLTVKVVGEQERFAVRDGQLFKLSAVLPGHLHAVAVVKGIADGIIRKRGRNAVNIGGVALIFPVRIGVTEAVGADNRLPSENTAETCLDIVIFSFNNISRAAVGVNDLLAVYRRLALISLAYVYLGLKPAEVVIGVFMFDVSGAVGDFGYVAGGVVFVPHEGGAEGVGGNAAVGSVARGTEGKLLVDICRMGTCLKAEAPVIKAVKIIVGIDESISVVGGYAYKVGITTVIIAYPSASVNSFVPNVLNAVVCVVGHIGAVAVVSVKGGYTADGIVDIVGGEGGAGGVVDHLTDVAVAVVYPRGYVYGRVGGRAFLYTVVSTELVVEICDLVAVAVDAF